jgi:hypothetical protein
LRDERRIFNIVDSTISSGTKLKNIRGVRVPEKGNAKNMSMPPIKDAVQRFFRFNVIGKYSG